MLAHGDFRNIRVACTVLQLSISRLLSRLIRPLRFISQDDGTAESVGFLRGRALTHLRSLTRPQTQHFVCVIVTDTFNAGEVDNVLPHNEPWPGPAYTNLRCADAEEAGERVTGPCVFHPVLKRRV